MVFASGDGVGIRSSFSTGGYVALGSVHLRGHFRPRAIYRLSNCFLLLVWFGSATVRPGASLMPARPEMAAVREVPQMRASSARGSIWREFVIYLTARTRPFILGANFRSAVAGIPEIHLNSAPSLQLRNRNPMRPEREKAFRIEFAEKLPFCSQRKRKTKRA